MTLEAIKDSLVNGFHDAVIMGMTHNYEDATVALQIDVLIEVPGDAPRNAERYHRAELTFSGVKLCVIEAPDSESAFPHPGGIWFKVSEMEPGALPEAVLARLSKPSLRCSFFVLDWHSNIHIAAAEVAFGWVGTVQ